MFESVGDIIHWTQLAVSLSCITYGLISKGPGERLLAPLGIALLAIAAASLSTDTGAVTLVRAAAVIAILLVLPWMIRLGREVRSGGLPTEAVSGRWKDPSFAYRLFGIVFVADILVVGALAVATGNVAAALLAMVVVSLSTVVMVVGLNRRQLRRSR